MSQREPSQRARKPAKVDVEPDAAPKKRKSDDANDATPGTQPKEKKARKKKDAVPEPDDEMERMMKAASEKLTALEIKQLVGAVCRRLLCASYKADGAPVPKKELQDVVSALHKGEKGLLDFVIAKADAALQNLGLRLKLVAKTSAAAKAGKAPEVVLLLSTLPPETISKHVTPAVPGWDAEHAFALAAVAIVRLRGEDGMPEPELWKHLASLGVNCERDADVVHPTLGLKPAKLLERLCKRRYLQATKVTPAAGGPASLVYEVAEGATAELGDRGIKQFMDAVMAVETAQRRRADRARAERREAEQGDDGGGGPGEGDDDA